MIMCRKPAGILCLLLATENLWVRLVALEAHARLVVACGDRGKGERMYRVYPVRSAKAVVQQARACPTKNLLRFAWM